MSDRSYIPGWSWLSHPLIGRHERRSLIAVGYCLVVSIATLLAVLFYLGAVDLIPGWIVRIVDGFTAVLIIAVVLSMTVIPTIYALTNGGPVMAATIGLVPMLSASILTLEYTLTNDIVVALVGAAIGTVVALGVDWRHHARDTEAFAPGRAQQDGLLFASGLTVITLVAVWRFDREAPAEMVATIDPLQWLVILPLTGCVGLWILVVSAFLDTERTAT